MPLTVVEICAGAGGQALGLEKAGFEHQAAIEIDANACATLRLNRDWHVIEDDVRNVSGRDFRGIDLFAGGVPCPPFSIAGKQLGADDERDLFPDALRLIAEMKPRAVILENVRGLATERFAEYREGILTKLHKLKYKTWWQLVNASDFGTPQLRPRFVLVAIETKSASKFVWPTTTKKAPTVGAALHAMMAERGWEGADAWAKRANAIAPTIVGGSKKHGGPDLGPTRARRQWLELGVNGIGIADEAPGREFPVDGIPKLTTRMVARLQGFGPKWEFSGKKTAAYRQVGNAFPPPVAAALGKSVATALGLPSAAE